MSTAVRLRRSTATSPGTRLGDVPSGECVRKVLSEWTPSQLEDR